MTQARVAAMLERMNGGLHLANALALTSATGLLMLASGKKKKLLRWKPRRPLRIRLRRR
jgi:hypothetical protein